MDKQERMEASSGIRPVNVLYTKSAQFEASSARWQSGLMRMTRNHVPSGAPVRIRLVSFLFLFFFHFLMI